MFSLISTSIDKSIYYVPTRENYFALA
ncbi:unnamed protein product [Debaryomyces tyrocola]|nr:unnamed protein product [Debaryomyces tyrocola]